VPFVASWHKADIPAAAEQLAVMNPKGALDGKTKQLIALGVGYFYYEEEAGPEVEWREFGDKPL
jgi:hypothetical protein